ncbi:hypothetical protein [Pedobacter sp.]
MKNTFLFLATTLVILLAKSLLVNAQNNQTLAKPMANKRVEVLKKVIAVAVNPTDNGLKLIDTISLVTKTHNLLLSTLPFPEAVNGTGILSRYVTYNNNNATVRYSWKAEMQRIKTSDSLAFNKQIGQLQETVALALPTNVRDTFYTRSDYGEKKMIWQWKPHQNYSIIIQAASNIKYNSPYEISLEVIVNKTLAQNPKAMLDTLTQKYTALTSNATTRQAAAAYGLTLFKLLKSEKLSDKEILDKMRPIVMHAATKDMGAAFDIIINSQGYLLKDLQKELTPEQLNAFRAEAKRVVTEFEAKQSGKNIAAKQVAAPPKPQKQIFNLYYTNDPNPGPNSKYVLINYQDVDGSYNIRNIEFIPKRGPKDKWRVMAVGLDQTVSSLYFTSLGGNWKAVNIRDCFICYGTGTETRKTPYTYYYEEKGIYNKYTYSGSGYNTTSSTCTSCKGQGYRISLLQ